MAARRTDLGLVTLSVLALLLSGCSGQQPALATVVATSNGNPLSGVEISIDDVAVGTTAADGTITTDVPTDTPTTIAASKKFFVTPEVRSVSIEVAEATIEINLEPYVFVPDFGNNRIVRMPSVDSAVSEYEEVTSIPYVDGALETHALRGPVSLHTDYDNGFIYIVDAPDVDSAGVLLRLSDFPPAPDGSSAVAAFMTGPTTDDEVRGAQQPLVLSDGTVILVDYRAECCDDNFFSSRLVSIPPHLDYSGATKGPWFTLTYLYGVTRLPDGTLLVVGGSAFDLDLFVLDDVSDADPAAFGNFTMGSGTDQLVLPTRPVLAGDGAVYIGDTGFEAGSTTNSRIVRVDTSGDGFVSYGSQGSGRDQFANPVILGILPDNRLYIMDVNNERLVRVDLSAFDGVSNWAESSDQAEFEFEYWYNFS
ncbi:MAG: hypothetical protein ACOC2N_01920 [Spirochaetota bacterium]